MKSLSVLSILAGLCLMASVAFAVAQKNTDEMEIRTMANRWQEYWNSHDMHAMATLLTEDADFVNVAGLHWKGRAKIESEHAKRHQTNLKNSVWVTRNVTVQILSPQFALVHLDWGISGDTDLDGTLRQPREGIFTWLVTRHGRSWLIRAAHNTNKSPQK